MGVALKDDKYMAASFVANLIRYKQESYLPDRDIILVLETDEENGDRDTLGIRWLLKNHRNLIDAEFALNEGGGVDLKSGKPIRNSVQTSEKVSFSYTLVVTNKGGHPPDLESRLFRKLQMIDDAMTDQDLRAPPSNHFEKLHGNLAGSARSASTSNGG
jgi:hypothetical protein